MFFVVIVIYSFIAVFLFVCILECGTAAAMPELPNDQHHQLPKQSHVEDHTEQTETASGEDDF